MKLLKRLPISGHTNGLILMKLLVIVSLNCRYIVGRNNGAPICGLKKVATQAEHPISFPDSSIIYPPETRCTWIFRTVLPESRIKIKFSSFDLPYNDVRSELQISEGKAILFSHIHNMLPWRYVSSKGHLELNFHGTLPGSSVKNKKYFKAAFQETTEPATCGHVIIANESSQTFYSPGNPYAIFGQLQCTWKIKTSCPEKRISIKFSFMKLPLFYQPWEILPNPYSLKIMENDKVIVSIAQLLIQPGPWFSSENELTVIFKTASLTGAWGLEATIKEIEGPIKQSTIFGGIMSAYQYVKKKASDVRDIIPSFPSFSTTETPSCGFNSVATSTMQSFSTPGFPQPYTPGINCTWTFVAKTDGSRIKLEFTQFNLRSRPDNDKLRVSEGGPSVIAYIGDAIPHPYVSSGGQLEMNFDGDLARTSLNTKTGFHGNFQETDDPPSCGHLITASESPQTFYSPGYPHAIFEKMECTWEIQTGNPENRIGIEFNFYSKPDTVVYDTDFEGYPLPPELPYYTLQVKEQDEVIADRQALIYYPGVRYSSGSKIFVVFQSKVPVGENGFSATVEEVPKEERPRAVSHSKALETKQSSDSENMKQLDSRSRFSGDL